MERSSKKMRQHRSSFVVPGTYSTEQRPFRYRGRKGHILLRIKDPIGHYSTEHCPRTDSAPVVTIERDNLVVKLMITGKAISRCSDCSKPLGLEFHISQHWKHSPEGSSCVGAVHRGANISQCTDAAEDQAPRSVCSQGGNDGPGADKPLSICQNMPPDFIRQR